MGLDRERECRCFRQPVRCVCTQRDERCSGGLFRTSFLSLHELGGIHLCLYEDKKREDEVLGGGFLAGFWTAFLCVPVRSGRQREVCGVSDRRGEKFVCTSGRYPLRSRSWLHDGNLSLLFSLLFLPSLSLFLIFDERVCFLLHPRSLPLPSLFFSSSLTLHPVANTHLSRHTCLPLHEYTLLQRRRRRSWLPSSRVSKFPWHLSSQTPLSLSTEASARVPWPSHVYASVRASSTYVQMYIQHMQIHIYPARIYISTHMPTRSWSECIYPSVYIYLYVGTRVCV